MQKQTKSTKSLNIARRACEYAEQYISKIMRIKARL